MIAYYLIDLESTGLKFGYHEVTEISIIRATDCMQLTRNVICESPERASIDALAVTHKTIEDLSKGHPKEAVVAACDKFFAEDGLIPAARCIVGHNIYAFDRKFLHALWESCGKEFPAHLYLDTLTMTKDFIKTSGLAADCKAKGLPKPKANLEAACDLFNVKKITQFHSAKSDVRNTYLLWKALVDEKKIDYLPFIKTAAHILAPPTQENEGLDISLLDL